MMNMKRRIICTIASLLTMMGLSAQEMPFFTNKQLQYSFFNPAYIPELQYATIQAGGRLQWTNLDGMPKDLFFSGKYFFLGAHSQVGLNILTDKIGYQHMINPKVVYSFCIPIGDDSYLNLGASAGMMNKGYNSNEIVNDSRYESQNIAKVVECLEKGNAADVDAGFEILLQNFEFGASAMHLLKGTDEVTMNRTFYGFMNYNMQTSEWWRLCPAYALYYYNGDKQTNSKDVMKHQLSLYYYYVTEYDNMPADLFYVGATYKIPNEVGFLAGFAFGFFQAYYSYDYNFSNLRHGNYGTHELGIEFKIRTKGKGCYANYGRSRKKYTRYYRN